MAAFFCLLDDMPPQAADTREGITTAILRYKSRRSSMCKIDGSALSVACTSRCLDNWQIDRVFGEDSLGNNFKTLTSSHVTCAL